MFELQKARRVQSLISHHTVFRDVMDSHPSHKSSVRITTMASFQALPAVLVQYIFSFVPNHHAVCNLGLTCIDFQAISRQDRFWGALCRRRWKLPPSRGYTKDGYKQRHLQEQHVTRRIRRLALLKNKQALQRGFEEISALDGVRECFWKVFQHESESTSCRKIARILLRNIEFCTALAYLTNLRYQLPWDDEVTSYEDEDKTLLEECIITVNRTFCDIDGPVDTTSSWIRQQLDTLANTIQDQFPPDGDPSPELKLEIMKQVFSEKEYETREASLNEPSNYLHWALKNNVFDRLNYLLLYKFVGRRIGLQIDIVGESRETYTAVVSLPGAGAIVNVRSVDDRLEGDVAKSTSVASTKNLVRDAFPGPFHFDQADRRDLMRQRVIIGLFTIWEVPQEVHKYYGPIRCHECVKDFLEVENIDDLW